MQGLIKSAAFLLAIGVGARPAFPADAAGSNLVSTQRRSYSLAGARLFGDSDGVDPFGYQQVDIKGEYDTLQSLLSILPQVLPAYSFSIAFNRNTISDLIATKLGVGQ